MKYIMNLYQINQRFCTHIRKHRHRPQHFRDDFELDALRNGKNLFKGYSNGNIKYISANKDNIKMYKSSVKNVNKLRNALFKWQCPQCKPCLKCKNIQIHKPNHMMKNYLNSS